MEENEKKIRKKYKIVSAYFDPDDPTEMEILEFLQNLQFAKTSTFLKQLTWEYMQTHDGRDTWESIKYKSK